MRVVRFDRFTVAPADEPAAIARRNALVAAVREAAPGLLDARLAKLDDGTWVDMWCWESRAHAQAAIELAQAGAFPQARAAFALTAELTTQFAELLDER